MIEFRRYKKIDCIEMRPYAPGETLDASVMLDGAAPVAGDMIARDPDDPTVQWLIRRADFALGFDPIPMPGEAAG